ncbi:MAG: endolytic transglycosylase MltG, partial [Clostridia bacterium]|nr:endolytic transglycosylase MltG [Clostridia bacterium]
MNNMPNNPNPTPRPARAVRRPGGTAQSSAPQSNVPQNGAPRSSTAEPTARPAVRRPQTPGGQPTQHGVQSTQNAPVAPVNGTQRVSAQRPVQKPAPAQTAPTERSRALQAHQAQRTPQVPAAKPAPVRPAPPVIDNTATRQMAVTDGGSARKAEKKAAPAAEKKKKKQMSEGAATLLSVVKAITYIVFVIVLAGFLSYFVIRVANDMFAFVKSDEQVTVTIPEYATINEVSAVLAEEGIITYPEVFKLYAKLNHDDGKFKAGDYEINGMMNYDELLMAFKERFVRQRVRLTIPEGYTVDEIIDLFVENGVGLVEREKDVWVTATREDYIAAVNNLELYAEYFDFVRALIGNTSSDRTYQLEGYLFPDTYEFYTDSKPSQIV